MMLAIVESFRTAEFIYCCLRRRPILNRCKCICHLEISLIDCYYFYAISQCVINRGKLIALEEIVYSNHIMCRLEVIERSNYKYSL